MSELLSKPGVTGSILIEDQKKLQVIFDQHGTYREPRAGAHLRCLQEPLSDDLADFLLELIKKGNLDRLRRITNHSVVIFKNLDISHIEEPHVEDAKAAEFKASTLDYETRPEQESGLLKLAQMPNVGCTMISAMPAEDIEWAMFGLGEGRKALDKDLQIILRRGNNRFVSKLSALFAVMYRFDKSKEESDLLEPRRVVLVDDDINFAETASRLLQIPVLVPIASWQEHNYPSLPIPKPLKSERAEVYIGSGLPDLDQDISEFLGGQIPYDRFNARRLHVGTAVELARPLSFKDLRSIPPPQRGY